MKQGGKYDAAVNASVTVMPALLVVRAHDAASFSNFFSVYLEHSEMQRA